LPTARVTNETGLDDSTEFFDDEEATFATERTSGLISDVFETDQVSTTEKKVETNTVDPTLTKSPSKEESSIGKDPSSFSKSPIMSMVSSEDIDHSYEDESTPVPTKKTVQAPQVKEKIDYSKRCNNVSIKYLRAHQAKMRQWRHFTLETLIDQQDCAVEAVKLEWLLRHDVGAQSSKNAPEIEAETPTPFEAENDQQIIELTTKEHRRLYDLLRY